MTIGRVFVANRGEIAVRILRACRALGLEAVVGVSDVDRDSAAARLADRAVCIGPARATDSYLKPETIVQAALGTGTIVSGLRDEAVARAGPVDPAPAPRRPGPLRRAPP